MLVNLPYKRIISRLSIVKTSFSLHSLLENFVETIKSTIFAGKNAALQKTRQIGTNVIIGDRTMARPIKETPILYGEDARRFEARMQERRRISAEERAEMKATYEALKSVCDFM